MMDPMLKYYDEVLLIITVLTFLLYVGNWIVKRILSNRSEVTLAPFKNGKMIGNLERLLILIAIIIQEWSLIGIVVALKTIARYKELDDQDKSEYFLIGSLFSLLWAVSVSVLVLFIIKVTGCFEQLEFLVNDKTMNVKIIP